MMLSCEASFEIERLQAMARGKVLPRTEEARGIFRLGFCSGAMWCVTNIQTEAKKIQPPGETDGSAQPAPLAPRLPMLRVPVAAPPGAGELVHRADQSPERVAATENARLAVQRLTAAKRRRRWRPLQPRQARIK
jgi:hypothetical protein